eukprot:366559-Chlamydomonas_euryale.AAC.2
MVRAGSSVWSRRLAVMRQQHLRRGRSTVWISTGEESVMTSTCAAAAASWTNASVHTFQFPYARTCSHVSPPGVEEILVAPRLPVNHHSHSATPAHT